jgi:membrane protease YdiL (CAAX protease family)
VAGDFPSPREPDDSNDPTDGGSPAGSGPAVGLRDAWLVLAVFFGSQLVAGFALAAVFGFWFVATGGDPSDPADLERLQAVAMPAGIAGGTIGSGIALGVYAWRSLRGSARAERRSAVGAVRVRAAIVGLCFVIGIAIAVAYVAGIQLFWTPEPIQNPGPMTRMGTAKGWPQWTWALLGLAFSPWMEEFVFRGQLLAALSAAWGRWAGAIVSTLLFLSLHLSELVGFPPGAFGITAMALAALAVRQWSGSVWPAIALHFGYNALLASGVLLASYAAG